MKKIFSVLLALIIAAVSIIPCFAKDDKCTCGEAPIVYVAALGSAQVIRDKGTENETVLFRPQTENVLKAFTPLIGAAAELIATKDYEKFGEVLTSCVNNTFGDLALDGNGDSKPNVGSDERHPDGTEHGIDRSYYFGYDFRLDPIENAELLHTYIDEVKEITKHDTLRIRASSMGGVVMMSYIYLYGTEDIETIIFQNCPILGTAVAGELFNGKVEINKDALVRYANGAIPSLDSDFLAGFLFALVQMLDDAGVWQGLVNIADELVLNLKDTLYEECLIPIFGSLPGIWSFVPHEYYESGKIFMQLDKNTQAGLIEKLDNYHYNVQCKADELLNGAKESGTNIYIVAGYNIQRTPLVTAYMETSDGTVDTKYASCGATCAPIYQSFDSDYIQAELSDVNYISPDRMIDASTCILPENTWFVKDMLHCTTHSGHDRFYRILFESDEQLTVFDMEEYPQFLQNDIVNEQLLPLENEENEFLTLIKNLFKAPSFINLSKLLVFIVNQIKNLF